MGICMLHDDFLRLRVCLEDEIIVCQWITMYTIKKVRIACSLYDNITDLQGGISYTGMLIPLSSTRKEGTWERIQ